MFKSLSFFLRTATLNDIYRHIQPHNTSNSLIGMSKSPPFRRIDGVSNDDYEEGTVTGYAMQQPIPSGFVRPNSHLTENPFDVFDSASQSIAGNKAGAIFA